MKYLFLLGGAFCGVAVILQFASTIVAILRLNRRDVWFAGHDVGVSVIRPVCGIENYIEETLRSTFQLDYQSGYPHSATAYRDASKCGGQAVNREYRYQR